MKQLQTCLTAESLRQLARDEFSPAELYDIEQHVTECSHCRELLKVAESDAQWRDDIRPVLRSHDDSMHLARYLAEGEHEENEGQSLDAVLRLLRPTDDPRMLGRIGVYEVAGVIGRGGMGVVFKALDAPLNRFVAIKMLLPHLAASGAARKRFAREGQAAAAVIDDHVMPIYSVAEWQGIPYLVTQYSGGTTLQKRIEQQGLLDVKEILRIGMQTARGLAAAHAQGLVHRDVKPSNILLDGTVERAMLTDFGLARAVDDASITRSGIIAGTPQYMSPEQARGASVDARSDLFGLGCVLYAMCTGRPPFRADNSHAVLRLITDEEPRPIREINPDIPEWLCSIVSKLMSKQPDDRFGSAAEVAGLLECCLAHVQHPTTAPLPECCHMHRERRGFSRIARILTAIGFAGLLILAGIVIVLELDKGRLTIECDADDVPVRITQGDRVVERLTVSKSGASVRIAAGNYVIEFDGKSDGITITNGTVELRRGEDRVVKIVSTMMTPGMITSEPAPDVGWPENDPWMNWLFGGKWEFDRDATRALGSDANGVLEQQRISLSFNRDKTVTVESVGDPPLKCRWRMLQYGMASNRLTVQIDVDYGPLHFKFDRQDAPIGYLSQTSHRELSVVLRRASRKTSESKNVSAVGATTPGLGPGAAQVEVVGGSEDLVWDAAPFRESLLETLRDYRHDRGTLARYLGEQHPEVLKLNAQIKFFEQFENLIQGGPPSAVNELPKSSHGNNLRRQVLQLEEQRDRVLSDIAIVKQLLLEAKKPLEIPADFEPPERNWLEDQKELHAKRIEQLERELKRQYGLLETIGSENEEELLGLPPIKTGQRPTTEAANSVQSEPARSDEQQAPICIRSRGFEGDGDITIESLVKLTSKQGASCYEVVCPGL